MSFILDALRKAETKNRDRHKLTVPAGPRVLTEELPEAPPAQRSWIWIVIAGLFAASLVVWWLFPGQTPTTTTYNNTRAVNSQPAPPPAVTRRAADSSLQQNEIPAEFPNVQRETGARALDREARRGQAPLVTARASGPDASTDTADRPSTNATSQRITPGTVTILQADGSLPADSQAGSNASAPASSRASRPSPASPGRVETEALPEYLSTLASGEVPIPELHLDMHVYSAQPAKRFVFINLDKYGEGDSIDRDTTVESIEPGGAVINHKGYRFVLRPE